MTLDHLDEKEFHAFLKSQGCTVETNDDYLDDNVVICCTNTGFKMPLQIKGIYYPGFICKVCEELNIKAPERFVHIKKQFDELKKRNRNRDIE